MLLQQSRSHSQDVVKSDTKGSYLLDSVQVRMDWGGIIKDFGRVLGWMIISHDLDEFTGIKEAEISGPYRGGSTGSIKEAEA